MGRRQGERVIVLAMLLALAAMAAIQSPPRLAFEMKIEHGRGSMALHVAAISILFAIGQSCPQPDRCAR